MTETAVDIIKGSKAYINSDNCVWWLRIQIGNYIKLWSIIDK